MENIVYNSVSPVWLMKARKDIGAIRAGAFVMGVYSFSRNGTQFSDWLANNRLRRRDFQIVKGWLAFNPFTSFHSS